MAHKGHAANKKDVLQTKKGTAANKKAKTAKKKGEAAECWCPLQ